MKTVFLEVKHDHSLATSDRTILREHLMSTNLLRNYRSHPNSGQCHFKGLLAALTKDGQRMETTIVLVSAFHLCFRLSSQMMKSPGEPKVKTSIFLPERICTSIFPDTSNVIVFLPGCDFQSVNAPGSCTPHLISISLADLNEGSLTKWPTIQPRVGRPQTAAFPNSGFTLSLILFISCICDHMYDVGEGLCHNCYALQGF